MSESLAQRLVGAWILEAYEAEDPDGSVRAPFGPAPAGLLVYGADGRMTVQVMDPRRPGWERRVDGPERLRQMGTGAEGYIAYAGRFDVEEDPVPTVVHNVELSLVPNWVGRPQRADGGARGRPPAPDRAGARGRRAHHDPAADVAPRLSPADVRPARHALPERRF